MPPDTWRKNDNRTKCEPAGAMNWLCGKGAKPVTGVSLAVQARNDLLRL
tara:strand:- start:47 stop:193 length:147 start_codon:yes stop_codon:yes gene_type:complete